MISDSVYRIWRYDMTTQRFDKVIGRWVPVKLAPDWWNINSAASGPVGVYKSIESAKRSAKKWGAKDYEVWEFSLAKYGPNDLDYFEPKMVFKT